MDLYLFDFDKTLYGYDSRRRLPALARLTGASQYHLAKSWWAGGFEARAEAGEWPDADSYLAQWSAVTGTMLTLDDWRRARRAAMTPLLGSIAAVERASALGTVSLLSNNPGIFSDSFAVIAPEVAPLIGANTVTSCLLGVRKPSPLAYERALAHFGASASDTFFTDDNAANVAAAAAVGIHAHHFTDTAALDAALTVFAGRTR